MNSGWADVSEREVVAMALNFCTAFDAVSTVIPGATSMAQLRGNLAAMERPMAADLRQALETFYEQNVRPLKLPW